MSEQLELFYYLNDEYKIGSGKTKVCIWCDKEKPEESFGLYNRNSDGRDNRCRACINHSMNTIEKLRKTAPEKPEFCDCCGNVPKKKFVLDHCHESEAFRGWLCDHCNLAIGLLGDNEAGVNKALEYLRRSNASI
jgi:hypothetical protein